MKKVKTKQKNIVVEEELAIQLEELCSIMNTNFATKTKELLTDWKISELKRLREDAPEMYERYLQAIKKPTSN